jgi:hypothetical protein
LGRADSGSESGGSFKLILINRKAQGSFCELLRPSRALRQLLSR